MTPAEHVREHLAASRADGAPFAAAWRSALEGIDWEDVPAKDRDAWRVALDWSRAEFSRAYRGMASRRGAAVMTLER